MPQVVLLLLAACSSNPATPPAGDRCAPIEAFVDADGDGHGGAAATTCDTATAASGGDCDDTDPTRHPAAPEACDGVDQDCDGIVDDGVGNLWWGDGDADGWGAGDPQRACEAPTGHVNRDGDCDDNDPARSPDTPEACTGRDDDCDGAVDGDDPDLDPSLLLVVYADRDGDGYGDPDAPARVCDLPEGHVTTPDDCDDDDPDVHEWTVSSADADHDGWGDGTEATLCGLPDGRVRPRIEVDCDDHDPATWPGAPERCDDSIDRDCDGASSPCSVSDARWIGRGNLPIEWAGVGLGVYTEWDDPLLLVARDAAAEVAGLPGPLDGEWRLDDAPLHLLAPPDEGSFGANMDLSSDLTGDGQADWVIADAYERVYGGTIYLYAGGAPLVEPALAATIRGGFGVEAQFGKSPATGDLDGDGAADLVVQDVDWSRLGRSVSVLAVHRGPLDDDRTTHDAEHQWQAPSERSLGAGEIRMLDADGDGALDLLIGLPNAEDPLRYQLILGPAPPSGMLADIAQDWTAASDDWSNSSGWPISVGDADGDGHVDALIGTNGDVAGVIRVDGPLTEVSDLDEAVAWWLPVAYQHGRGNLLVDLDGDDGDETLTAGSTEFGQPSPLATFRTSFGAATLDDADTLYRPEPDGAEGLGLQMVAWPDVDGDGGSELIVSDFAQASYTGAVYLLLGADLLR